MAFVEINGLRFFAFDSLSQAGLLHGIFTRKGGVSPVPWYSLNTGGLSGDARANVVENRARIFHAVNLPVSSIFDVWQVHSNIVVSADRPRPLDEPHQKADAIVTRQRGISLFMRFGDCVPILFFDPDKQVIGIAHAGWAGTLKLVAQKTVEVMLAQFGCRVEAIKVGIGPSIGPDHYSVGIDVVKQVNRVFGEGYGLLDEREGLIFFDLWKANERILRMSGIRHIEICELCTACHTDDWYSHRQEKGQTGRFGALISLGM